MQRCHTHKIAVSKYSKSIAGILQFNEEKNDEGGGGGGGGGGGRCKDVRQELKVLYN